MACSSVSANGCSVTLCSIKTGSYEELNESSVTGALGVMTGALGAMTGALGAITGALGAKAGALGEVDRCSKGASGSKFS